MQGYQSGFVRVTDTASTQGELVSHTELPPSLSGIEDPLIVSSLLDQMKLLRVELAAVTHEVSSFRQELALLKGTLSEVEKKVGSVEARLTQLENKAPCTISESHLLEDFAKLKSDLNEREQSCLLNDIEITGITERNEENLHHVTGLIASKIGVTLDERDVVYVERSGPRPAYNETGERSRPRPIVVRLARRSIRDQLLRAARVRRGADTTGLEIDKEPKRFYINERLTKTNRVLFYHAREEGRRNGWRYIWTREGRIYARRSKDTAAQRIKTQNDISKVFVSTRV
ncbi:uncharacterized protein LOC125075556 [Vanessa atalanta]|uniref:uncharacterized protein LOC125075556 n=1 Tax=Vanessa atalanta TaxID=42275 RepID=UPI001FCD0375|nr:uncharacterized protein LOC125075556 [Vanessa atalanta]